MARTIIKDGTVVNSEGTLRADLIIEGEKVSGIVAAADVEPAAAALLPISQLSAV